MPVNLELVAIIAGETTEETGKPQKALLILGHRDNVAGCEAFSGVDVLEANEFLLCKSRCTKKAHQQGTADCGNSQPDIQ